MKTNYSAFTLAEILITLGIIGVAAALTMPALIAKQRQAVLNAQFKKSVFVIYKCSISSSGTNGLPCVLFLLAE